jgi:hypothetical protein
MLNFYSEINEFFMRSLKIILSFFLALAGIFLFSLSSPVFAMTKFDYIARTDYSVVLANDTPQAQTVFAGK